MTPPRTPGGPGAPDQGPVSPGASDLPSLDPALAARVAGMSPAKRALFLKAAGIDLSATVSRPSGEPELAPRPVGTAAPLSFAQELLWLMQAASPGMSAYNSPRAYTIRGPLDVDALQRALDQHVERHEVYRTTITVSDEGLCQVRQPGRPVSLELRDLRAELAALPAGERDARVRAAARAVMRVPFDLEHDQLLRGALFRTDDDERLLVLVSHHIASDGWSRGIMFREIAALYAAARDGVPHRLPPVAIQYADFAAWQRAVLSGARLERGLAFWRQALAGVPALLELPTDRPRTTAPAADGERLHGSLGLELTSRLKAFARANDATLFMVLLAGWQLLLARLSRQGDIVVGTPVAGRSRPEVHDIIGYFADTVVIRTRVDDNPTVAALVRRVRELCLAAFEHQEVPYEKLLAELAADRGGTVAPLFQSLFVMHDDIPARLTLEGVEVTGFSADGGWTKDDVGIAFIDGPSGLRFAIEYRTDLFDRDRIERMSGSLRALLEALLEAPSCPVLELPIVSADDTAQLARWNATRHAFPDDATLIGLIEAQAARTPGGIALQDGEATLTFAELDRRAARLARELRGRGVRPGAGAALFLPRSFDLVVGMLAAMKAGAHYVPLDPEYPSDRVAYMLGDARAPVLVTSAALRGRIAVPDGVEVLVLEAMAAEVDDGARPLAQDATPDDLAYVIYTSGSTGRPKGVMIPHRAVVNYLEWMRAETAIGPGDCVLQKAPASFDASIWEFFLPLVSGARLLLARAGAHQDPDYLLHTIAGLGVTIMQLVPSQLQMVLEARGAEGLGGLRLLVSGGEALSGDLLARLDRAVAVSLINLYGPTEATVYATIWRHDPRRDGPWDGRAVPIGEPIHNVEIEIVDPATLQRMPVGVPGELLIVGPQVARGYHGQPEQTAQKFLEAPPGVIPAWRARRYRTGDLARWRPDGIIEYLGRIDNQVKLRGFRIELGEIEEALARHPAIGQCAVLLREDQPGDQRIVAYIAATDVGMPSIGDLRAWVRQTLPEFMVPSVFVRLERIPLNANGKADRKSLPAPTAADATEGAGATAATGRRRMPPRTTLEHQLLRIWQKLLATTELGIQDDFFESGGHSLLALRLITEVHRETGRRLPLASLFEASTIEQVARRLESSVFDETEPAVIVMNEGGTRTPFVFLHGDIRGGGWYARRMAQLLGADTPVYVLPTLRHDQPDVPYTIEGMAAFHVRSLKRVRAHGPYHVGGYCAGGVIAYEMARQLAASGDTVERVVLIDSAAGNARFRRIRSLLQLLYPVRDEVRALDRRRDAFARLRHVARRAGAVGRMRWSERVAWLANAIRVRVAPAATADPGPTAATPVRDAEFDMRPGTEALRLQGRAVGSYIPEPYGGPVDLITSVDPENAVSPELLLALGTEANAVEMQSGRRGWEHVTSRLRVFAMRSSHVGLITERLPLLTDRVRQSLFGDEVAVPSDAGVPAGASPPSGSSATAPPP